jgi:hypothetical protein
VTATTADTASHAALSRMPSATELAFTKMCWMLMMTAHVSVRRAANTEPRLKPASIAVGRSENVYGELHAPVIMMTAVTRANSSSIGSAWLRSSVYGMGRAVR